MLGGWGYYITVFHQPFKKSAVCVYSLQMCLVAKSWEFPLGDELFIYKSDPDSAGFLTPGNDFHEDHLTSDWGQSHPYLLTRWLASNAYLRTSPNSANSVENFTDILQETQDYKMTVVSATNGGNFYVSSLSLIQQWATYSLASVVNAYTAQATVLLCMGVWDMHFLTLNIISNRTIYNTSSPHPHYFKGTISLVMNYYRHPQWISYCGQWNLGPCS
jgi:hypothetical protein